LFSNKIHTIFSILLNFIYSICSLLLISPLWVLFESERPNFLYLISLFRELSALRKRIERQFTAVLYFGSLF
jgi:hypothetical protein